MKHFLSRKLSLLGLALLLLTVMPIACKKTEVPQDVAVNPAFEMNPPIAKTVSIQKLDDKENNLLVVADFGKGTIKSQYHAIELASGKVVLRDDGQGVDETADDGKFSIAMHDDLTLLEQNIEAVEKNREQITKAMSVGFKGREVVQRDLSFLKDIRLEDFRKGRRIPSPPDLLCRSQLDVSPEHSLMVVHPDVLGSVEAQNMGAWTFGTLMNNIANEPVTGVSGGELLKSWLLALQHNSVANTDIANARPNIFAAIRDAIIQSGTPSGNFDETNWQTKPLDPYKFQVSLLAIVNRLDLRGNPGYGHTNGGEGRFVFELLDPETSGSITPAVTFILEYGIPIRTCVGSKDYAQKWYDLKNHPIGSPMYNSALKAITDVFSAANANPTRTNGSALNQFRTNDRALSRFTGNQWEMREFKLDPETHKFVLSTTAQEPIEKFNEASAVDTPPDVNNLVAWINANEADVLADKHSVPLTIEDQVTHAEVPFLGAKGRSENGRWDAPGVAPETRHHFSLNTCTGCHRQETNTGFLHINSGSLLSGFLTGIDVLDPVQPSITHHFNDLAFREDKLKDLLCTNCTRPFLELIGLFALQANAMVH